MISLAHIKQGAFICTYLGELKVHKLGYRAKVGDYVMNALDPKDEQFVGKQILINPKDKSNIAPFIAGTPPRNTKIENCISYRMLLEVGEVMVVPVVVIVAKTDIHPGDYLFYGYGDEFPSRDFRSITGIDDHEWDELVGQAHKKQETPTLDPYMQAQKEDVCNHLRIIACNKKMESGKRFGFSDIL